MKTNNPVSLSTSLFNRSFFSHFFSGFILLFLLGGCTHHYIPNASTFKLDAITEFSSNNTISLVNAQSSTEDVLFASRGAHKFYGNFKKWTDTAIEISKRELNERGMNIEDDSQKSLKLSIETVNATFGFWVLRCEVTLKVETSDGYVKSYLGDNRSPASLYRAADGAVMRAVTEMLRDEKIVTYLKQ